MRRLLLTMTIPELLREVQQKRGYCSVEDMAWHESMRIGERIPIATLRSWMTASRYQRHPDSVASLRLLHKITGEDYDKLMRLMDSGEADSR